MHIIFGRDILNTINKNVISFENCINNKCIIDNNQYKFRVVPVIYKQYYYKDKSDIDTKKRVLIELVHLNTNLVHVHCFTDFVMKWKNKSYNTQKNKANTIVRFLNYLLDNNEKYKLRSFSDLDIFHGEDYLSELSINGANEKYFLAERKTLDKFYMFLASKNLLNTINISQFEDRKLEQNRNYYRGGIMPIKGTIFEDCIYPSKSKNSRPLHHLKDEFIIPFIQTAAEVAPRIALGVYISCFGGFRRSEVVSTKKNAMSFTDWGMLRLEIKIDNPIISEIIKDSGQALVKRNRKQEILNIGDLLPKLLKEHLIVGKYYATDGTGALFSNKKGKMLTAKMYSYYFEKVKSEFISKLLRSSSKEIRLYGIFLKMEKWSTHICRGIASNFIADSTENALQVSIFRGDKSINSAIDYTEDTEKFKQMIYDSGSKMYEKGLKMDEVIKGGEKNE